MPFGCGVIFPVFLLSAIPAAWPTAVLSVNYLQGVCLGRLDFCADCAFEGLNCARLLPECFAQEFFCQEAFATCGRRGLGSANCIASLDSLAHHLRAERELLLIPKSPKPVTAVGAMCFHGSSVVFEKDIGKITLEELYRIHRTSDRPLMLRALDKSSREPKYSPLQFWLHADPNQVTEFRLIHTSSSTLKLTPRHLIYRAQRNSTSHISHGPREPKKGTHTRPLEAVFARDIAVGDNIFVFDKTRIRLGEVLSTDTQIMTGVYAPFTKLGTVLVDKVGASCFAEISNEEPGLYIMTMLYKLYDFFENMVPQSIGTYFRDLLPFPTSFPEALNSLVSLGQIFS